MLFKNKYIKHIEAYVGNRFLYILSNSDDRIYNNDVTYSRHINGISYGFLIIKYG